MTDYERNELAAALAGYCHPDTGAWGVYRAIAARCSAVVRRDRAQATMKLHIEAILTLPGWPPLPEYGLRLLHEYLAELSL